MMQSFRGDFRIIVKGVKRFAEMLDRGVIFGFLRKALRRPNDKGDEA